jgi:hypothetical protein
VTGRATSAGPLLMRGGKGMFPVGSRIRAGAGGRVWVTGGWSNSPASPASVYRGTEWVYHPIQNGVVLTFPARGESYRFLVWYKPGSAVVRGGSSVSVTQADGRRVTYSFNSPLVFREGKTYSSAYDAALGSIEIKTRKRGTISYAVTF